MKAPHLCLIVLLFSFITSSIFAQQDHLEVEGDVKIRGDIDIHNEEDTTSLYIGEHAGENVIAFIPLANTYVGVSAGRNNLSSTNAFFGYSAGSNSTNGQNSFFGGNAGINSKRGANAFFGTNAGADNDGRDNSFFGHQAGFNNVGNLNSFFGKDAGLNNAGGTRNVFIGPLSGPADSGDSLDRSIAIGYMAKVNCSHCAVIGGTGAEAVNLGIGLSTPAVRLDVDDIIRVGGATYPTTGEGLELVYDPNQNLGLIQSYDRNLDAWGKL